MVEDVSRRKLLAAGLLLVGLGLFFALGFWWRGAGPFGLADDDQLERYSAPRDGDHTFTLHGQLAGARISLEYRSLSNASLDILLLDEDNHRLYASGGAFDYIEEGSRLDTTAFKVTWQVARTDSYYWVVDNTLRPAGGAYANRDVAFKAQVHS